MTITFIVIVAASLLTGVGIGVHLIGGWRKLRADLLQIDRDHLALKRELARIDRGRRQS